MSLERVASGFYCASALGLFLWTIASPHVSITDLTGPLTDFVLVAAIMWPVGAVLLICSRLAQTAFQPETGDRLKFVREWIAAQRAKDRFVHVIIPIVAFVITMASFTAHKALVLPQMEYTWDMPFVQMDRWLFFGIDPWQATHHWMPSPTATWLMDKAYHAWFYPMFLAYVVCALMMRGALARACYLGTYLISWLVIGTILAGFYASAGPAFDGLIFDSGQAFKPLIDRLAMQAQAVGGLQSVQLQNVLYTGYQQGVAGLGYGISAMPSMHIALAAMWLCLFWSVRWWLGILGLVYTILIWIGSVHLAWHYAVDGLVSLPVILATWAVLKLVFKQFPTEQSCGKS